ncbi:MAG: DUF1214 domain-containing protein [Pseudomonadota bacterium]
MQVVLRLIVAIIFGLNLGALSALWFGGLIDGGPKIGNAIDADGWRSDWSIGSENANPYVRARVARNGLMGLRKEEAVYFMNTEDQDGARLTEDCDYRVSGGAMPAAWWSITLYDVDNRLPMNEDAALSFDQTKAERLGTMDAEGWSFLISATAPDGADPAWVSSRAGGEFDVTLRLYQPSADLLDDPEAVLIPPKIERLSCRAGAA